MLLVDLCKEQLQKMRNDGWEAFIGKVSTFCVKHNIQIPDLNDVYAPLGRKKRGLAKVTNLHHFQVDVFLSVVDIQLQELDNRFDEVNKELLICMACLCPLDRFSSFDTAKLLRLATFYLAEFSSVELIGFEYQLENFIVDMRRDERFWSLKNIGELSMKLFETKNHVLYSKVYLLLKLVLLLPVETTSVKRAFSSMTFIKNKVCNSIGNQLLNNCLVTYIEKDLFLSISDDDIVN
ncbi:hypothetical protein Dimus_038737 [Dionaea muscipula]